MAVSITRLNGKGSNIKVDRGSGNIKILNPKDFAAYKFDNDILYLAPIEGKGLGVSPISINYTVETVSAPSSGTIDELIDILNEEYFISEHSVALLEATQSEFPLKYKSYEVITYNAQNDPELIKYYSEENLTGFLFEHRFTYDGSNRLETKVISLTETV